MVDFSLKRDSAQVLSDHREWTRDNGRNNALRINGGLGAPRAFNTSVLRRIGFPNVSYGEDYAVALRISRNYEEISRHLRVPLSVPPMGGQQRQRLAARGRESLRPIQGLAPDYRDPGSNAAMIHEVEDLFKRQLRAWPQLSTGVEGLARATTRSVRTDWFDIYIRHIPHRMASTTAGVDRESVAKRPCFLCPANLPSEEEGLPFDENFTIYCNPFPIVDRHLTIAHREHGSQRIADQFGNMLDLAAALPGYFIVYNGPECGASAPDHMHFQAGSRYCFQSSMTPPH